MNDRGIRRLLLTRNTISSVTGARTCTPDDHYKLLVLNAAAGQAITLPASLGDGLRLFFLVGTSITSSSTTIKVANTTDVMNGTAFQGKASTALTPFLAAATDDTITMDGSTKGGVIGDRIELIDFAAGFWAVVIWGQASSTVATPFSATV